MITQEAQESPRTYRKLVGVAMWQSQLRKGSLDLAVLAALWDAPLDRMQIRDRLERMAGISVVQGVLYPLLRRLRQAHWVRAEWIEIQAGHARQLFWLTDAGRQMAMELSWRWTQFADGMNRMVDTLPPSNR